MAQTPPGSEGDPGTAQDPYIPRLTLLGYNTRGTPMAFSKEAFSYAWHGSGRKWDAAPLQIGGGAIGGFLIWYWGLKVPSEILDNPALSGVVAIIIGAIIGAIVAFILRLLWWPFHKYLEPCGGLRAFLPSALRAKMLPIFLMGAGVVAFVGLFGTGAVLFAVRSAYSLQSSSMYEPLPKDAKFKLDNQVFWFVPQPYTPKEAREILEGAEELDNFLSGKMIPAILSLKDLVTPLSQRIKDAGGPKQLQLQLREADTSQLIPIFQEAMLVWGKYPTHRADIDFFFLEGGKFGTFRGHLHALEAKLQVLPEEHSQVVVDAIVGPAQSAFIGAIEGYRGELGAFHQRLETAKPEFRSLLNRP